MPQPRRRDADTAWKQALQALLPDFLALVHPEFHAAIDWQRPAAFLDKELQAITRQGRKGRRAVDLLASVWLREGREHWLLIHVEVQGRVEEDFARRMFIYHARLVDRYNQPVVSLAILTDGQATWRPDHYRHDFWSSSVAFEYPIVKVLDWQGREGELATLANPFAQVLLAQLSSLTARAQIATLAETWRIVMRRLLRAGYTDQQSNAVLTFLERIMALPEDVEASLEAEFAETEGTTMTQLMNRWARRGWEQGLSEGRTEGRTEGQQELVLGLLEQQCGPLPPTIVEQVRRLPGGQIAALGRALLRFGTIAEVEGWLAAQPSADR